MMTKIRPCFITVLLVCLVTLSPARPAVAVPSSRTMNSSPGTVNSPDRAVRIAQRASRRVENSGQGLQDSARQVFQAFAERTVKLQKLIDTRRQLEQSGLLDADDADGAARQAHINGRILIEVGEFKKTCDAHLGGLLQALDDFDQTVADSLVDSQGTRSINSNYELSLEQYLKRVRGQFEEAMPEARESLRAWEEATEPRLKEHLRNKYLRAKQRLQRIVQRRKLYEARLKVSATNQKIAGLVRDNIRRQGHEVPARFFALLNRLYIVFAKVTPVAEVGGTAAPALLVRGGMGNLGKVMGNLQVFDDSVGKLDQALDGMVNAMLAGLNNIQIVEQDGSAGPAMTGAEEMECLRRLSAGWKG